MEGSIQLFLALDNKADTLNQSQMLKVFEQKEFMKSQSPETQTWEKIVFEHHPNHDLCPPGQQHLDIPAETKTIWHAFKT
jgi:hypothetical protein